MMESKSVSVKIQGPQETVELVVAQLKKVYKMLVVGQIMKNDQDNGVHIFLNIDPQLANKVVKL